MLDEDSLRRKAEELARREIELEARERGMGTDGTTATTAPVEQGPKKNFPICYPLVYHNPFSITDTHRKISALFSFGAWVAFAVVLVLNLGVALVSAILYPQQSMSPIERVQYVLFSFIYIVVAIPGHMVLVYWPYYQCMSKAGVLRFIIVFLTGILPVLFCLFGLAGWYPYGVSGIVVFVGVIASLSSSSTALAVFLLNIIMCTFWAILVICFVLLYLNAVIVFRRQRHSLKEARDLAQQEISGAVSKGISSAVQIGLTTMANQEVSK